jgi:hypothetical protein
LPIFIEERLLMKYVYYSLIALLFPACLAAQEVDFSYQLIAKAEEMRKQNIEKCKHGSYHHCCHSSIYAQAARKWTSLTPQAQTYFRIAATRPTVSGTPIIYNTANFDIHYTTTGKDSVPLTDVNPANSIPDYIDFIAAVLDSVYINDVKDKYTMPPPDGVNGGSAVYDVYIQNLGAGLYGYCQPEAMAPLGDNPNSPAIIEKDAMTSYLVLSNDYSWTASVDTSIKVTVAHEFFHAIQFGYESNDSGFLYEATAVWMEDHRYPGLDDNLQYLPDLFLLPDVALNWDDQTDGTTYSGHFYSAWLYFKHMTDYTNDSIIRTIFINSINNSDFDGIDKALLQYGKNFKIDFQNFLISNLLLVDSLNYPQFSYPRAQRYKNYIAQVPYNLSGPKIEGIINYSGADQTFTSNVNGNNSLLRLGADYINVFPSQDCFINMTPYNSSASFDMVVVAKDQAGQFQILNTQKLGNNFVADVNVTASFNKFTAIICRNDYNITNQNSENYTVRVQNVAAIPTSNVPTDFRLYPNPASYEINIEAGNFSGLDIQITDILGRAIYAAVLQPGGQVINTSALSSGMYFVTLKENDKVVFKKKIIINN